MNLDFDKQGGLIPAIVQDARSGEVLMLAYVNPESWTRTLETKLATFYSRSRQKLWTKGEQSGHTLRVQEIRRDCDSDAVLLRVDVTGPGVCHEGYRSCFSRALNGDEWQLCLEESFSPAEVYGAQR